jgi:hypothetical protein
VVLTVQVASTSAIATAVAECRSTPGVGEGKAAFAVGWLPIDMVGLVRWSLRVARGVSAVEHAAPVAASAQRRTMATDRFIQSS